MPEMPLTVGGVTRLVWVDPLSEDTWQATLHQYRRLGVLLRRSYYEGDQYDEDNLSRKQEVFPGKTTQELLGLRLPEHRRKHAYSGTIKEGIDFLADQVTSGMTIDGAEDEFAEAVALASGLATRRQEITREILIAGDVFARLKPMPRQAVLQPDEPAVKIEFWEAEDVEVDYDLDDWTKMTEVRYEELRMEEGIANVLEEVRYVHKFSMGVFVAPDGLIYDECIETVFRGDDDEPWAVIGLGLPFIPWMHLSGEQESLRSRYGKPLISGALMETADRFNAVSQLEFLALRYNSFGNLAVTGDAAQLKVESAHSIPKDVADVLAFPGGTNVQSITLSIDVDAFQDAKKQLLDEMFDLMGLSQVDDLSVSGLGNVSGYALEILNRKSDGTFRRIAENVKQSLVELFQMAMWVDTYAKVDTFVTDEDGLSIRAWWLGDPDAAYPDQELRVRFGTTYIVDEVAVRDDFVAGLISQQEALRQKGYDDDQIARIVAEQEVKAEAEEQRLSATIQQGTRFSTERA